MKRFLFTVSVSLLLLSCSENTTNYGGEEVTLEAFDSQEFHALQSTYDEYVFIEASIKDVFDNNKTSKLSKLELDARKEAYVQKITQKMFEVKKKRDIFLKKYPSVGEEITTEQLRNILRKENE